MRKRTLVYGLLIVALAACGSAEKGFDGQVPTRAEFPTLTPYISPTPSITPSATLTLTPSSEPSATFTIEPSLSPTASPTPSATSSPQASPSPQTRLNGVEGLLTSAVGAYVRTGPSVDYAILDEVLPSDSFWVLAFSISAAGEVWYLVRLEDGREAWISSAVATLANESDFAEIALAATVPPSPSPTPEPSATPRPTLPAGANARVSGSEGVNLRTGPDYAYPVQRIIAQDAPLRLIGRDVAGGWYEAQTFGSEALQGWVLASLIDAQTPPLGLSVTWTHARPAPISGIQCGVNIHPREGHGWPIVPSELRRSDWVRFPFTSSRRHFPSLEGAFAYFDGVVAAYNQIGVKVLFVLTHETYGEDYIADWTQMGAADWNTFIPNYVGTVERIAAHYGDRVAGYEVWNEGDAEVGNEAAVAIPPSVYARLLRESAYVIRQHAPSAYIVLGGLLDGEARYLAEVRRALGGTLPVDAIAVHPYGLGAPNDETVFSRFGDIGGLVRAYNRVAPGVPLWLTEAGAIGANDPSRWAEATTYLNNLFDYLRGNHSARVDTIMWYGWSDAMHANQRVNGLVTLDNRPKSPLYEAFFAQCSR